MAIPPWVQAQIDEGFAEAELWIWRGRLLAQLQIRQILLMTDAEREVELVRLFNELSDRLKRVGL